MKAFVDTSALYALIVPEDVRHSAAEALFQRLRDQHVDLVSSNYVLLECASLLQRRHGFEPAKAFLVKASSLLEIVWIGAGEQEKALTLWNQAKSRTLSLVDCTSFAVMQQTGLRYAVAFDVHFRQAGFELITGDGRIAERRAVYRARHA